MKFERDGLLLPELEDKSTIVDYGLDASYSKLHAEENHPTYKRLTLDPGKKQDVLCAWHSGANASLESRVNDQSELDFAEQVTSLQNEVERLKAWKRELLSNDEVDSDIKQAYRWKINEDIANVMMILASLKGKSSEFKRWNKFIYGEPDETIYRAALDWVAHDAEMLMCDTTGQSQPVISAAQDVLVMLKDIRGYRELLHPDKVIFESVRSDHYRKKGYYGLLLAGVKIPEGRVNNQVGDPILQQVIKNIGSDKPLVDAADATWGVSSRGVERPKSYNMPSQRFIGLGVGHEIGTHELERTNGSRGPLALASEGLDRYEAGNEGRAVIREQVLYQSFDEFSKLIRWRDIMRRHIAISYACGVGEDHPATSLETYDFINIIDKMYALKASPNDEAQADINAQKKTDDLLLRVLKGTDGLGGAYLKDKVYLEGHVTSWLTASYQGVDAISNGDLGKFDINNPRHITLLQKLKLLPIVT